MLDCLPTPGSTVQKCGCWARVCAHVGAGAWEARLPPREVEGLRIWPVPLGPQVESEDLWLVVSLSPSPGGVLLLLPLPAFAELQAKPPPSAPPASYPLSRPHPHPHPAASPGGQKMQVTRPELPIRAGLGLRCLRVFFLVQAGLPWQLGGTASAPSPRWAQGAMGMIQEIA